MADVSGTVYTDRGVTPMGSGRTLDISINGAASAASTVTGGDGTYSFTGLTIASGDVLSIYIQDGVNPEKALTVTKGTGSNMAGIDLWQDCLVVRSDNGASFSGANLNTSNNNGATGITALLSAAADTSFTIATGKDLCVAAGQSFTTGSGTSTLNGSLFTVGTLVPGGTFSFQGSGSRTITSNGAVFRSVTISNGNYALQDDMNTLGIATLSLASGDFNLNGRTLTLDGSVTWARTTGTFTHSNGTVVMTNSGSSNFNPSGGPFYNLTKSGAGTRVLNTSALTVTNALNITEGTISLNGQGLVLTGATFTNAGTLQMQGGETLTSFTNDTANGGTVTYVGTGTTSYTGLIAGNSYANLTFNGSGRTWTLNNNLTVSGVLTRTAGTLVDGGYAVNVGGNWTNTTGAGAFTLTGTTTLNGAGGSTQTISGSTTFYNLVATAVAARALTFTDGTTQTVSNSLTLTGSSGQLLTLQGSSTGGWTLAVPATQSLGYLSVSRSTATGNTALAGSTSTDGGNNTNWNFGPPVNSVAPSCAPSSGTVSDTFTFSAGTWTGSPTSYETSVSVDGGAYSVIDTSAGGTPAKTGTQLGGPGTIATRVRAQNAGGWSGYVAGTTLTVTAGGRVGTGMIRLGINMGL